MAINDIINESWQGHSHGEVEQALKDKIQDLTERLDNLSPGDVIGYNQLSSEVKQLLTRAQNALQSTDIAAWAKAANKPSYNANEIVGVEGFANLLAKLQAMDTAIAAAAESGGDVGLTEEDISVETNGDGTVDINVGNDTYSINLNHTHENMAKLIVCEESDLPSTLDPATIYAQVDDAETPTEIQSLWIAGLEFVGGGGGAADDSPKLTSPRNGATIDFDGQSTATLVVKGKNLTSNLSVVVTGDFTVTANGQSVSTIAAADVTDGASITLTLTKGSNFLSGSIEISSSEIDTARVSVKDSDLFDALLVGVKFTGSQWVNTGIGVGPNTSLKLDIEFTNTFGGSTNNGVFVSTSNRGFAFNTTTEGGVYTDIFFWVQGQSVRKSYGNALYARGEINYAPGSISFLGQSATVATKTTTSEDLAIGYSWPDTAIFDWQHFIVYGLKVYQNNVLSNDFIPVIKQGVAGLFDTINGVFISSETSTELVAVE